MSNLEQLFKNPKDEICRMENDYRKTFGPALTDFIKEQAKLISSQYHDQCAYILTGRFIEMNKIVDRLPSEPSKEQYDQCVQNILALAEPSEIVQEMAVVINNKDVYTYYQAFLKRSDKDIFHQLYIQCAFTEDAILHLNQLAMVQIKESIHQLQEYIDSLHSHNELIKQLQEKRQGDKILKTSASLFGLGIGIPFLGLGLGALLGSGDKQKIKASLGNIFDQIDSLEEGLYDTVDKLGESLYLLFFILFGGTFISVNNALKTQNLCIEKMNEEYAVIYSLTPEEKEKFEKWFHVSMTGITALVKEKRWHEAIRIVKEMHQTITDKPIHSIHEIEPGKSALYLAHVYYYAVYQEALLEEYRAGHIDSFLMQSKAFLDTLILYPLEKDFPPFASHPAQFIFLYVKQYLHHYPNQLYWLNRADEYISKRHENMVLMGEYGKNPQDYIQNVTTFFVVWEFFDLMNKVPFKRTDWKPNERMYSELTEERIDQFIAIDHALNHPDEFSKFLQTLKKRKKKAKRAPFIRWSIRIAATAALITLLIVFSKPLIPEITNTTNSIRDHLSESTSSIKTDGAEEVNNRATGGNTPATAAGETIVKETCVACHAGNLQGMGNTPALVDVGSRLSEEEILTIILNGRGGMPGGLLLDEEAEAAAEWLATQK